MKSIEYSTLYYDKVEALQELYTEALNSLPKSDTVLGIEMPNTRANEISNRLISLDLMTSDIYDFLLEEEEDNHVAIKKKNEIFTYNLCYHKKINEFTVYYTIDEDDDTYLVMYIAPNELQLEIVDIELLLNNLYNNE